MTISVFGFALMFCRLRLQFPMTRSMSRHSFFSWWWLESGWNMWSPIMIPSCLAAKHVWTWKHVEPSNQRASNPDMSRGKSSRISVSCCLSQTCDLPIIIDIVKPINWIITNSTRNGKTWSMALAVSGSVLLANKDTKRSASLPLAMAKIPRRLGNLWRTQHFGWILAAGQGIYIYIYYTHTHNTHAIYRLAAASIFGWWYTYSDITWCSLAFRVFLKTLESGSGSATCPDLWKNSTDPDLIETASTWARSSQHSTI